MAINTTCEHCVFRVNDKSGQQTGCKFGRLETFKMRGEAVKEPDKDYYKIGRFCNYCRVEKAFTSIEKLLNDTRTRFSILLTLDQLKTQDCLTYKGCELFVTVKNGKEYKEARDLSDKVGVKYKINISDDPRHTIKKLKHHKNNYLVLGNVKDKDLEEVDKLLNMVMEKVIAYETDDVRIVMKALFSIHCFEKEEFEGENSNKALTEIYDNLIKKIKAENEQWRDFIWSKTSSNNNSSL